jgi:hypothetical protein
MPIKKYWLHSFENSSRIGIMTRPNGNEWLEEEILNLKKQGVGTIVSLLEQSEVYDLGLEKDPELSLKHGIEYISFPIADRNVPNSSSGIKNLISRLEGKISGTVIW